MLSRDKSGIVSSSALLDSRRSELEVYEGAGLFDLPYDASGNLPKLRDLLQKKREEFRNDPHAKNPANLTAETPDF